MKIKIVDKYIVRELGGPFLLGVGFFTVLLIASFILPKLTELFAETGVNIRDALLLFIYLLPRHLVLTFAMATLLAVLLGLGRMSAESEIVALHAAGLSLPRLAVPGVIFGLFISLLTLAGTELIAPESSHRAEIIINEAKGKTTRIAHNVIHYEKGEAGSQRSIYAAWLDTAQLTMGDVTITEYEDSMPVGMIHAKWARRSPDGASWTLLEGETYLLQEGRPAISDRFQEKTVTYFASPQDLARQAKRRPYELSINELKEQIAALRRTGEDPTKYEIELPRRISLPFASLVFAVIGTPLGMRSHRKSSSLGIGLTILIVFFYYIVWNFLAVAAESGSLSPAMAAWLPNIAFGAVGLALIFAARK